MEVNGGFCGSCMVKVKLCGIECARIFWGVLFFLSVIALGWDGRTGVFGGIVAGIQCPPDYNNECTIPVNIN